MSMSQRDDSKPMTMPVDRRTFLIASGAGFAGMTFGKPALPELSAKYRQSSSEEAL